MNSEQGSLHFTLVALASLASIAMWLDYFRRIDVFEKEKILPLLFTLAVGGLTPWLSLQFYSLMSHAGITEGKGWLNDLIYAVFVIGLNEETCKLIGVALVFLLLRKKIDEPIDFLIYAGVTALGFSMVENFNYFMNHGVQIITSRSFYSALEHIINTSIIVYGVYRRQLFNKGRVWLNTLVAFVLAVSSHAMFDFFLRPGISGYFTAVLSLVIYLVGINFWVQMLNNANNHSRFFDYDKVPFSPRLVYRLLLWYLLTLVIAFINNLVAGGFVFSIITLGSSLLSDGFLFLVVIMRVSRFKILQNNYQQVKMAFPFYFTRNSDQDFRLPLMKVPVKIRGENSREHLLTRFLNREVEIFNAGKSGNPFISQATIRVESKHLLHDDVIVYRISFPDRHDLGNRRFFLKPKMGSFREIHHLFPVQGLFEHIEQKGHPSARLRFRDLHFLQWVYLKVPH